jgi:hypothetical protein
MTTQPQLTETERLLLEAIHDHPGGSIFTHQVGDYAAVRDSDVADLVQALIRKGFVVRVLGTYQHDEHLILSKRVEVCYVGGVREPHNPLQFYLHGEAP